MIAVIPAAGMASRLRPLTENTPKSLLKVGDRELLRRIIDALLQYGVEEIVIVTGYLHEMIEGFVKSNYPDVTVHFVHNADYQTTNNIYSLYLAGRYAAGKEMLLMDSDILFDPQIIGELLASGHADALALMRHPLGEEEMKVIPDEMGYVKEISKTCSISDAIGESLGIELMSARYTAALYAELEVMIKQEGLSNIFYERAFERLIPQGFTFYPVDTTRYFAAELDTPADFNQAKALIPKELY
jgi:choline kinase